MERVDCGWSQSLLRWRTKWVLALCEIFLDVDWEVLTEWKKTFNGFRKASHWPAALKLTQMWHSKEKLLLVLNYLATSLTIARESVVSWSKRRWDITDSDPKWRVLRTIRRKLDATLFVNDCTQQCMTAPSFKDIKLFSWPMISASFDFNKAHFGL